MVRENEDFVANREVGDYLVALGHECLSAFSTLSAALKPCSACLCSVTNSGSSML